MGGTDMGGAVTTARTATGAATGAVRRGLLMSRLQLADPTLTQRPTPGMDMDTGTDTGPTAGVDTTDLMAMATGDGRSGLLMRRSPPAVPTLTLRPTRTGGATGATGARLLVISQFSGHNSFFLSRNLDQ